MLRVPGPGADSRPPSCRYGTSGRAFEGSPDPTGRRRGRAEPRDRIRAVRPGRTGDTCSGRERTPRAAPAPTAAGRAPHDSVSLDSPSSDNRRAHPPPCHWRRALPRTGGEHERRGHVIARLIVRSTLAHSHVAGIVHRDHRHAERSREQRPGVLLHRERTIRGHLAKGADILARFRPPRHPRDDLDARPDGVNQLVQPKPIANHARRTPPRGHHSAPKLGRAVAPSDRRHTRRAPLT